MKMNFEEKNKKAVKNLALLALKGNVKSTSSTIIFQPDVSKYAKLNIKKNSK